MDGHFLKDPRGHIIQRFVAGQKAFHKFSKYHVVDIAVHDLEACHNSLSSKNSDESSDHIEKSLDYKKYTWELPWDKSDKTWAPFATLHRYRYQLDVSQKFPDVREALSASRCTPIVIIQLTGYVDVTVTELARQMERNGPHVFLYQKRRNDAKSDIMYLLHRMWNKLLPVYEKKVESDEPTSATVYTTDNVVLLFNRIINKVTELYNREILFSDPTCAAVCLDMESLLQTPVGDYYPGAMELLYDMLVASSANWYGLHTFRIEDMKLHVSGKIFLSRKPLELASNQYWREDYIKEKPFNPLVDRDNLWILGCLILRFHGLDDVCDNLLKYLPDLSGKDTLQHAIKDFPLTNTTIVSLVMPGGISPSVSCLIQIFFHESLYFPENCGYANVIKFFQYVLNGCRWSKDRENVMEPNAVGLWGRTSTHRFGVGHRSLFFMRKDEREKPLGQGAYGEVCRFLEEAESGSQLFTANAAGKTFSKVKHKVSESYLRALLQLKHPNIVEHLAIGQEITTSTSSVIPVQTTHIVMETYAGHLLSVIRSSPSKLTDNIILRLMAQVSCGVAYLHNLTCPIIHGDLKSENILLTDCTHLDRAVAKISDIDGGAFRVDDSGQRVRQRAVATDDLFRNGMSFVQEWTDPMVALGQLVKDDDSASTLITKISQVMNQMAVGPGEPSDSSNPKAIIKNQLSVIIELLQTNPNSLVVSVLRRAFSSINKPSEPSVTISPERRKAVEEGLIKWINDRKASWSEHSNPHESSSATHVQQQQQLQEQLNPQQHQQALQQQEQELEQQQLEQRLVQQQEQQQQHHSETLNDTHRHFTYRYAAPEVLAKGGTGQFDKSVDIWSLGCILLELCYKGELKFKSSHGEIFMEDDTDCEDPENFKNKFVGVGNEATPVISEAFPEIFRTAAGMCIQKEQEKRASASSLYEMIVQHLPDWNNDESLPVSSRPYTHPYLPLDQGLRHLLDAVKSLDFLSGQNEDLAIVLVSTLAETCERPIDLASDSPDIVFASGICPPVIRLFRGSDQDLVHEAIRLLWAIAEKVPAYIEQLVMMDLLHELRTSKERFEMTLSVPFIACRLIDTIARKSKQQITVIWGAGIVPVLVRIMRRGDVLGCRAAALALESIHKHGSDQQKSNIVAFEMNGVPITAEMTKVIGGNRELNYRTATLLLRSGDAATFPKLEPTQEKTPNTEDLQ